ncbi:MULTISPECIES: NUDIX domain-containing protein [unclassified Streptomyces]|uniref:NUDIX domain-containing protein n=1 Tax=Streptomyces TaxID=1883 RepID=UPI000B80DDC8|nr:MULTISPECIES: NUDIX domain-containing protein [unclassified Streptomyces]
MLEPTYKEYREIPGGCVEVGESPLQACVREGREELGNSPEIGRLLAVDWAPGPAEGDKVRYLFDGGVLPAELRDRIEWQVTEIGAYGFHPSTSTRRLPPVGRRHWPHHPAAGSANRSFGSGTG